MRIEKLAGGTNSHEPKMLNRNCPQVVRKCSSGKNILETYNAEE